MKRLVVILAGLAMLAPTVVSRQAERRYDGNRFGRLTSEVWRFRAPFQRGDLQPVAPNNPYPEPQPHRDRPERLVVDASGTKLYVTLAGTEAEPGHQVAVVDIASGNVIKRIDTGVRPYAPYLHPGGRFIVVINELSNYASVIDTQRDEVVSEIAVDYYCQGLAFSDDGTRAWVANRYLDQVLVIDLEQSQDVLHGRVRVLGGFDELAFFGSALPDPLAAELRARGFDDAAIARAAEPGVGGINAILRGRCGRCHTEQVGGFIAGADPLQDFLSAIDNAVPGHPEQSPLLRAVVPSSRGGFGDQRRTPRFHSGGVLFAPDDPELALIEDWIRRAEQGPGILVGNEGSHPKDVVLAPGGRHLFVGNTGTMDVSIIDLDAEREVGALFIQNVASHLAIVPDPIGGHHQLVVFTMGAGFGATKERDPHGAETWDRDHEAAQFTVLRDPETTDAYPLSEQFALGPFDAVDGTWNFKMRDIQSDVVVFDLARLEIPEPRPGEDLEYLVHAGTYESSARWVRYTSDTAEATTGDVKGDVPPELMRVPGSFFEWAAVDGDRIFTTMAGSFEIVEWRARPAASDPADVLEPIRVFETGLRPVGVAVGRPGTVSANNLFVADQLGETVTIIDRASGAIRSIVVGDLTRPALDTDAEKGEVIAHTSIFSSDGDTSCLHCHYRDTGDGRGWGAGETIGQDRFGHFTPGGTLGIPQMKNVYAIQPFYFEGTHRLSEGQGADINEPASSIDFDRPIWAGDFRAFNSPVPVHERRPMHEEMKERVEVRKLGAEGYDLDERRNAFFRHQSMRYFGASYGITDLYRFMTAWMGSANHLLPNPYDETHPSVVRGRALFNDARVMCGVCHAEPEFANKSEVLAHNPRRAMPQILTTSRRDASYTLAGVRAIDRANGRADLDLDPGDGGRVEGEEGSFTTMQLRGIFDRPPVFLHHGRARSLREVVATPGHPALRRYRYPVLAGPEEVRADRREHGMNELTARVPAGPLDPRDQILDTHGGTSHLSPRQVDDLVAFMKSIE